MLNLGPTTRSWLAEIGLTTDAQVLAHDPIELALILRRAGHPASLNLVYALAGARCGCAWNALPSDLRHDLQQRWHAALKSQH